MVIARKCLNLRDSETSFIFVQIEGLGRDCVEMGHGVVGWDNFVWEGGAYR